nr:hypothetical protein [Streptomyces ruber]
MEQLQEAVEGFVEGGRVQRGQGVPVEGEERVIGGAGLGEAVGVRQQPLMRGELRAVHPGVGGQSQGR